MSVSCLIYIQTVSHRSDEEITKQVYMCQYNNPSPGNWCYLGKEDLHQVGIHKSREHITFLHQNKYKKYTKHRVQNTAFHDLDQIKKHTQRLKTIITSNTSKLVSSQQWFLIFTMKSKIVRGVMVNFWSIYSDDTLCPLCKGSIDAHKKYCSLLRTQKLYCTRKGYMLLTSDKNPWTAIKLFSASNKKLRQVRDEQPSEASDPGHYFGPLHSKARTNRTPASFREQRRSL